MAKRKPKKKGVLSDHARVGKKFFPPAARFGWTEVHYVERILPENRVDGIFYRAISNETRITDSRRFSSNLLFG
jgi:hypothetical protein